MFKMIFVKKKTPGQALILHRPQFVLVKKRELEKIMLAHNIHNGAAAFCCLAGYDAHNNSAEGIKNVRLLLDEIDKQCFFGG